MKLNIPHIPVLFDETISAFSNCEDGYIIDCTTGFGGHSQGLLENYSNIKLICNDQDIEAFYYLKNHLKPFKDRIIFNKSNFKTIIQKYKNLEIKGILADIGVSSLQLDKMDRGFGFRSDKLDMRMDKNSDLNGYEVVNYYHLEDLEKIFKDYENLPFDKNLLKKHLNKGKDLFVEWAKDNFKEFYIQNEQKIKFLEEYLNEEQDVKDDDFFYFDNDLGDESIKDMHYEDKDNASEYMQSKDIDKDLILDVKDALDLLQDAVAFHTTLDEEYIDIFKEAVKKFIYIFELSGEFRDMAKALNSLFEQLNYLESKEFDSTDDIKIILKEMLDGIFFDLQKWANEVLNDQSAIDIHYLDASLMANIAQMDIMLQQKGK